MSKSLHVPVVFSQMHQGKLRDYSKCPPLLVCRQLMIQGRMLHKAESAGLESNLPEGTGPTGSVKILAFPFAVVLAEPLSFEFGGVELHGAFLTETVEEWAARTSAPLTDHAASVALGQIAKGSRTTRNDATLEVVAHFKPVKQNLRNAYLALAWTAWRQQGLGFSEMAEKLNSTGAFQESTKAAVRRAAQEMGLE